MKKTHSNNFVGAEEVEFKKDTKMFLKQIIKDHLNAHMDSYMKRYYGKGTNTFTGWKSIRGIFRTGGKTFKRRTT